MNKRHEASILDGAIKALLQRDPTIIQLELDGLGSAAARLGVSRSTLGSWRAPASGNHISSAGIRAIAEELQAVGAHAEAREFIQKLICKPLGLALAEIGADDAS